MVVVCRFSELLDETYPVVVGASLSFVSERLAVHATGFAHVPERVFTFA